MQPHDGRVVSSFVVQALRGEPITVFGDGGQSRSFCYVDDLVEAISRLMLTDDACTGPINLGNNSEFTILELAEKVISLTHSRSKLILEPMPQDDPRQRQPDLAKAKKLLAWEPKIALAEGSKRPSPISHGPYAWTNEYLVFAPTFGNCVPQCSCRP